MDSQQAQHDVAYQFIVELNVSNNEMKMPNSK